jgi:hypothetical protein
MVMGEAMRRSLITLATCLLISPAVVAQDTPSQPKVIPPGVVRVEGDFRPVFQVLTSRRARLGISVNLRARDTDSISALVSSVTPNGPAAKAGIRSGDVIVKLGGTSLLDGQARTNIDDSAPGLRLTELAARLEPNDTIGVEFRRGKNGRPYASSPEMSRRSCGELRMAATAIRWETTKHSVSSRTPCVGSLGSIRRMTASLAIRCLGWGWSIPTPRCDSPSVPAGRSRAGAAQCRPGPLFRHQRGHPVISVPTDSKLGLKGGDVVLAVDGREPVPRTS